jgi:hypothetical protein
VHLGSVGGAMLLLAAAAAAAPGTGNEFVVVRDTAQQMRIPHVAFHAATSQFLVVWSERGNRQIRGRLVGLDGSAPSGDLILGSGDNERDFPKVAHVTNQVDPNQRVSLVVWDDGRDGENRIWGQFVGPSGALAGQNFQLSSGKGDMPALAYGQTDTAEGVFLTVWNGEAGGRAKVFGKLLLGADSTGSPGAQVTQDVQIADSSPGQTLDPAVAYDPVNRQFLVVWADTRGAAGLEYDIWGQFVKSDGTLNGGNFRISSQPGIERAPALAYHPVTREFLVLWNAGQPIQKVYGQRVSMAGTLVGTVIPVATAAQEETAGVTVNPDTGHYVVALNRERTKVEIQLLSAAGALVGQAQPVSTDTTATKGRAVATFGNRVVCSGSDPGLSEVMVVWPNNRAGSSNAYWQELHGRSVEVSLDSDCDGLLDDWETSGIDIDGDGVVELDLPALGARPNHKDLFIELDFFDCAVAGGDCSPGDTHTHLPLANAINTAVAAFAAAPVTNPDGLPGVTLHVQVDEALSHRKTCPLDPSCFTAVKAAHFGTQAERANPAHEKILAAKRLVYRYVLWAHDSVLNSSVSGISELPGNDSIISLGSWGACVPGETQWCDLAAPACPVGSVCQGGGTLNAQTGTFIHELGHTLGLHHGGADNINCKPNYLSLMSYVWQTTGLQPGNVFTYSDRALPTLNENNLNEADGIQDGGFTTFFGPPATVAGVARWRTGAGQGPIDWNGSCPTPPTPGCDTQTGIVADINDMGIDGCRSSPSEMLAGYRDWDNLQLNFRQTAAYVEGQRVSGQPEMTEETARAIERQKRATVLVPKSQQLPVNRRGYPLASNLDWATVERAAQSTFDTVEGNLDRLASAPPLAALSPPIDLTRAGPFQWPLKVCRGGARVGISAGGQANLAPAGGPPLAGCSRHPAFSGNVVTLVGGGSLDLDLEPLRQSGLRVVAASALVRRDRKSVV